MTWKDSLKALAAEYGIASEYWSIRGTRVEVPQETLVALLEAMGVGDFSLEGLRRNLREAKERRKALAFSTHVLWKRKRKLVLPSGIGPGEAFVLDEDGEVVFSFPFSPPALEVVLPEDSPWGYYTLLLSQRGGPEIASLLVFSPHEAYLEDQKIWGVHGALFALATERSQGIGDLKDLEKLCNIVLELGGKFFGLLPLHLTAKRSPGEISPYLPLSRLLFDPIYLPLEEVSALFPGLSVPVPRDFGDTENLVDYERTWQRKDSFLRSVFRAFWEKRNGTLAALWNDFQEFMNREKDWLFPSSLYLAIASERGSDWQKWPLPLQKREERALALFAQDHEHEVLYFSFLQWLMHGFLKRLAAKERILCFDLPVGCAPSGIESWLSQDKMAFSCTVGAPPDDFSPEGQNWGFHPFSPLRMEETRYTDFIALLRMNMRFARFLRLDHIMGLKRLFWIPEGKKASEGTYVEYPFRKLLAILTLESVRNGVTIIGEDLGTVPRFLRSVLRRSSILSTRVFYFERDGHLPRPPEKYPKRSYATLNTHDMPPLAAFLKGDDITTRLALRILTPEEASFLLADREEFIRACFEKLKEWGFLREDGILPALFRFLVATPSLVVSISIDDLLGNAKQLNLPGTTWEYPNWRHRIFLEPEDFEKRLSYLASFFDLGRRNTSEVREHF